MTILLRFCDLKARGVARNWPQLNRLIELEGFPPGRKLSPNTRVWTEDEVEAFIASRPVDHPIDVERRAAAARQRTAAAEAST
jgi:predicted DNA-binding transcriptional regulator AlpA